MTHQHEVFVDGEADGWFQRNQRKLIRPGWENEDPVLQLLARSGLRPKTVLEVGAANGFRLAVIASRYECLVSGVEPSAEAIRDGESRFPEVRFYKGVAHDLRGLTDGQFDLVVVNFVLHWLDRAYLLRSVAELDRVLADGGHLVVSDFLPDMPQRVRYHHLPEADVWTYKQDYPRLWLASQTYDEVAGLTFRHDTREVADSVEEIYI